MRHTPLIVTEGSAGCCIADFQSSLRCECIVAENPKIRTKCNHYFHLACIYEWMERKQTCPICDTPMNFEEVI